MVEKGKISSLQMAMILYPAIIATAILHVPSLTAQYAGQDLWISPILASIIGFVTVFIAVRLCWLYPGKNVFQIIEETIGRLPGKLAGLLILFFYIEITGEMTRGYGSFIVNTFLKQTPLVVTIASMVFLCAFAVYGGIEVLARAAQFFFPLFFIPFLFLVLLLSPYFQVHYIEPVLADGWVPVIKGAVVPSGWFAELFLIVFLIPYLTDKEKAMKLGMLTVAGTVITLVIANLTALFVLGPTLPTKVYALVNASHYISYADFFENLESVTMAIWIIGAFVKISAFYYVIVLGIAQWLNLSDYRPLIWPIGILIVEFGYWSLPSSIELARFESRIFPFYSLLMQTTLLIIIFVIASVRKKGRKKLGLSE
ncbi:endospore germination permease [Bacillus thermotolerans]|uniref:GerAB/ArcD/ProY family transporter n=1 Tax=Bacillus thermotolerans TaxID=1221996 RepID=UPI000591C5B3|nr:endospore germination permease [Bacillus thermotolerans]KKB36826.1 Spore germination protein GerKB [Bacillus thermotolerans]